MAKSIDILMPDPCVDPYLADFKFLGMIREGARNLYRDERLSLEDCAKKVEGLIHAHIQEQGMEELLAHISITAPDFEEKLGIKGDAKDKASQIEYAIRETIRVKVAEDPRFYESLQDRLESVLEEYRIERKDEADLLREMVKIKNQEERKTLIAKDKGLSEDEFAFYGLLEPYGGGLFSGDDKKMRDLTKKMFEIVSEKARIVDWSDKSDIQKETRREIKELLGNVGFEAGKIEAFTREVVELAKTR